MIETYYERNRAQIRERQAKYYQDNKDVIKEIQRRWRRLNRAKYLAINKRTSDRLREEYKTSAINIYSNGDACCSWCRQADIDVLCLDHINNDGAKCPMREKAGSGLYRWLRKYDYPDGFQVLCANCNMKKETEFRRLGGRICGKKT